MFTKASIVTLFASIAAAQLHAPVGQPNGNAITRPLNEVVPACKPFTITWEPTTPNTVSVLLLKGPPTNVVKFGPSIAEGIANSGSLVWTPSADLIATTGPTGYGIQLIDDVTGQYQYSTQFGISKDGCVVSSSAAVSSTLAVVASSAPVVSAQGYSAAPAYSAPAYSAAPVVSSPVAPYPTKSLVAPVYSTGVPYSNGSAPYPTGTGSARPSFTANATTSILPESTGAASALQAGLSLAGAFAAVALML